MMTRGILVAWFACFVTHTMSAQEIFTDFENASLESWTIAGDTVRLVGAETWTEVPNGFRWVHFRIDGMLERQPEFRIGSMSNRFFDDLRGHRFVWSHDQENWNFFDNNSGGNTDFRFSNDVPFTQPDVYVAYSTPYPLWRTRRAVEELATNWFVMPTTSGNPELIVDSLFDLPLYGFRITNPLVAEPKTKIVLVGGNHSGEPGADHALEGMLDFLTSDDARARQMRNEAEFFVYPQVDPLGRSEGYYRGNSQNPASDHNRFWNANVTGNNGGFAEIDILSEAMRIDTEADVDFALDFHGFFDSAPSFVYTDSPGVETAFIRELQSLTGVALEIDDSTEPEGIFEFWAKTPDGLNADFSFTPEFSPNLLRDELLEFGRSFGEAFFAQLGSPEFIRSPTEIDVLRDALQADQPDVAFDLNRNGVTGDDDLEFLLDEILDTVPGDTDLNGSVNLGDFLALSRNFNQPGGWRDGEFDGNGTVDIGDFLALSRNFGTTPTSTVPEPSSISWVLAMSMLGFRTHRRIRSSRP